MDAFPTSCSKHTAEIGGKTYDVYKLIDAALALPMEIVSIDSLLDFVSSSICWRASNGSMFGPVAVKAIASSLPDWESMRREHPEFADHITQIEEADTSYPILILGENHIVDGNHRVAKIWIEGGHEILAKRFHTLPQEALLTEDSSDVR